MTRYISYRLGRVFCLFAVLTVAGCSPGPELEGEPVNLEPNDPRPVLSVQVADADEAMLLVQSLELEPVRMDRRTVFFYEDTNLLPKLEELGYELKQENLYDVYHRVVRIDRSVSEDELIASGVQIINREKQYLIIRASIGQLRALKRSGSEFVGVSGHEPRPRQVRMVVDSVEDVAKIGAMAVDIYSAKPERKELAETHKYRQKGPIVVYGGAFDYQIDQLKEAGYSVEILPRPSN